MSETENYAIGRYELLRSLGKGSQGSVYLAKDPALDRHVAIKVLKTSQTDLNQTAATGTPLEALIASKLTHTNIVPIFDAGECELGPYLIFEYVEGNTLSAVLKTDGPCTIEAAAPLMAAILDGMSAAHTASIVHLDLNPRNVLLDSNGTPRIMDFGLSRFASFVPTSGDVATGTLRYMAPEHFLGQPLGSWTDVFALGSTFYELVTGHRAMRGGSVDEIRQNIIDVKVDLQPLNELEHGKPFAKFIAGALEADERGRYPDGAAMREAFDLLLGECGLSAASSGTQHSTIEFLLRRMQRKQDFPTISTTLADINRLTSNDSDASADKLANVILRDLALTSKLLKLVNSAFYGVRTAEISSISQAVVYLGVDTVRMTANSLMLFGHLKGDSAALKDSMIRSFLSGLVSRHLAQRARMAGAEEAFICGLCQNLGENLVIYYFPDEYDEIDAQSAARSIDKAAAARGVLGVTFAELGAAVAGIWGLPAPIVAAVKGLPAGRILPPVDEDEKMTGFAVFANCLCEVFQTHPMDEVDGELASLLEQFSRRIDMDADYTFKLVNAAFEKLKQYSQVFEIDVDRSIYCQGISNWLLYRTELLADSAPQTAEGRA